ncbi:MAG: OadG family protein [Lachnospiraceae bacterium]
MNVAIYETALLNMIMGMGTVFAVLILISGVISCFRIFPYLEKKRNLKITPVQPELPVIEVSPIQEKKADSLELIAVIAAAIAAEQGCNTTDFIVKSIRRREIERRL